MLLELAIGDAYGAGFEYARTETVERYNDATAYVRRNRDDLSAPGCYTDDTQMSLAIAESLISGEPWTPESLASRFVEVYHRDRRGGYARGFQSFLDNTFSGQDFVRKIRPDSDKSGAAMRACPIGVLPTVAKVLERATLQAKVTHDTPDGIAAACAAALMSHYFLYGYGPKRELGSFLETYVPSHHWAMPYRDVVRSQGWMSVRAAVTAVIEHDSLTDILRRCIAFTGDVDTVATIAMGAASCSSGVKQDLPETLVNQLENGRYGRDYLCDLDAKLLSLVKQS